MSKEDPALAPDEPLVRPVPGRMARVLLHAAGHLSIVLAIVGVFLPIMPTVPFLILAAACYARSSARFHGWLLNHRHLGPPVRSWYTHRSLTARQKFVFGALVTFSLALSTFLFLPPGWPRWGVGALWIVLMATLARIPTRAR
jgi:uncharacterized membrane protein YbaN (DUF454 family)